MHLFASTCFQSHCGERLAEYKRPRDYIFIDKIPKSASGKILRRLLRDEVQAKADRL